MAREFEARDQLWDQAVVIAEEACAKANDHIAAQCSLVGISPTARSPVGTVVEGPPPRLPGSVPPG